MVHKLPQKAAGFYCVNQRDQDFTLLNVAKQEEIYLEHFGMMDHPQDCQKAIQKIHSSEKQKTPRRNKSSGAHHLLFDYLQNSFTTL